eukprot:2996921-Rhodomonas_salina.1
MPPRLAGAATRSSSHPHPQPPPRSADSSLRGGRPVQSESESERKSRAGRHTVTSEFLSGWLEFRDTQRRAALAGGRLRVASAGRRATPSSLDNSGFKFRLSGQVRA